MSVEEHQSEEDVKQFTNKYVFESVAIYFKFDEKVLKYDGIYGNI